METKELKIQIPDGYEIDKEKSTFEKIVFKKKDTKPRSWEEYCCQQQTNCKEGHCINNVTSEIQEINWGLCTCSWKTVLPSKELAEAFLAMMQLMSLRQSWIGDWEPNWEDYDNYKYCVFGSKTDDFCVKNLTSARIPLSFPTEEMATDFMNCFRVLLEIAKPLI